MEKPPPRKAALALHVCVIGGGFSGLAAAYAIRQAGHTVHVYEAKPSLEKEYHCAYIPENLVNVLTAWGVFGQAEKLLSLVCGATMKSASGRILSKVRWDEEKHSNVMGTAMRRIFVRVEPPSVHAPILMRHSVARRVRVWVFLRQRSDLQSLIYELATSAGVQVSFSSKVVGVDLDGPCIMLENGDMVDADLIVGADGYKGSVRSAVMEYEDNNDPLDSRFLHGIVPAEILQADPLFPDLITDEVIAWTLPERYAGLNPAGPGNTFYGFTCIFKKSIVDDASGTLSGRDLLRKIFDGYDPQLLRAVELLQEIEEFHDIERKPLEHWYHETGRLVLTGSACHPIRFPAVQDCALSIEDAQVLGSFLSRVSSIDQLPFLLDGYQEVRQLRCEEVIESEGKLRTLMTARLQGAETQASAQTVSHETDELPLQEQFKKTVRKGNTILDGSPTYQHDASAEAEHWWKHWGLGNEPHDAHSCSDVDSLSSDHGLPEDSEPSDAENAEWTLE